jgi:transcriptional antiterminator/mannitol/fructose-specific phosphotransferase system IIA component (Ntr-type)
MDLSKRHLEEIQFLLGEDSYVDYQTLSERFKVSERTIRYDLDKIQDYLDYSGLEGLKRDRERGVCLDKNEELDKNLKTFYNTGYTPQYYYSREERRNLIFFKLLESEEPLNIWYFQDYFGLSKNTILKELNYIEEKVQSFNLKLIRKPRIGIYIEGREMDRRRAILDITYGNVDLEEIFSYMNFKVARSKISNVKFNTLFSDFDIDFLNGLIRMAENKLKRNFTDEGYGNLITHIALMIKRIQLQKEICLPEVSLEGICSTKEYKVAHEMILKIESTFQIEVPKDEIYYIAMHLLGTKVTDSENVEEDELMAIAKIMLEDIETLYGVRVEKDRMEMIENLIRHIRPSLYRIQYGLKLKNPMFESIYKNYKELFHHTRWVCRHLEEYIGKNINDHEIAYLTLHFGAALERAKKLPQKSKKKIVLFCATGLGTAQMLATQISNKFDCEVVKTLSSRQKYELKNLDYDEIISTVEISGMEKSEYIKVNAMLLQKDLKYLEKYLKPKYNRKESAVEKKVKKLIEATLKYADISDKAQLAYDFLYILKQSDEKLKIEEKIYMLKDLLCRETIKLGVAVADWKEAINEGADVLLEKNSIEKTYVEAIFNNFETLGAYMVVAPGIVLSHARPEDGVNDLSMSLITLKEPVEFGSELNDPVKLIVTLAAKDSTSHLKALSQLMNLFMEGEDLATIMKSSDKNEVLKIIKKHSREEI